MVKTNGKWLNSVVCTLIDNDIHHHSGQNLLWTHEAHNILTTVMKNIAVNKSTDNAEALKFNLLIFSCAVRDGCFPLNINNVNI